MSREERAALIDEAESLITGGVVVHSRIVKRLRDLRPTITPQNAKRVIRAAYASMRRRAAVKRASQFPVALAECDRQRRLALTAQRIVVVDGAIERVPQPDLDAYRKAGEREDRLLGLNAPERKEVIVASFDAAYNELADVMRAEIRDPLPPARELLLRLARRFKSVLESGARVAVNRTKDAVIDATTTTVVPLSSSLSSSSSGGGNFAVQSDGNGTAPEPPKNGHAHGDASPNGESHA